MLSYERLGQVEVFFGDWGGSEFWGFVLMSTEICIGYNFRNWFVGS